MLRIKYIIFVLAVCLSSNCKEQAVEVAKLTQKTPKVEITNKAAPLYVDLEGNLVRLSDYKGKRILLNYWATWCRPCIEEMPSLLRAQELLKNENYVVLLASDQAVSKIKAFKEKRKFEFNYLKFNGSYASLKINALPTTHVYNEAGEQLKKITGMVVWDSPEMLAELKDLH